MALRLALVIAVLLCLPSGYFVYIYGKSAVTEELIAASRRDDAEAFAARVDWEGLRAFLKEDIAAQKKQLGPQRSAAGPAPANIAKVVDHYVRPENIPVAYYYHAELFPQVKEEDFISASGFAPPFGFYVTLAYPKSDPLRLGMPALMHERFRARLVFRLDGFTWKISELHLPLYMVPSDAHPLPEAARDRQNRPHR